MVKGRLLLLVILLFVLGSSTVSGIDSLSYAFKATLYGIAMTAIVFVVLMSGYKNLRRVRN